MRARRCPLFALHVGGIAAREVLACRARIRALVAGQGMNRIAETCFAGPTAPSVFPNRRCEIHFFTRTSAAPKTAATWVVDVAGPNVAARSGVGAVAAVFRPRPRRSPGVAEEG